MDSFPSQPAGLVWWVTAADSSSAGLTAARPAGRESESGPAEPGKGRVLRIPAPDRAPGPRASADCRECETASQLGPGCPPGCGQAAGGKALGQTHRWRR